jgi:hypothetical protein
MPRLYLIAGVLMLSVYSWTQYRGVGLFDNFASSTPQRGGMALGTFHK